MTAPIPIIDLSIPEAQAAQLVHAACTEHGFFYVNNHGISEDLVQRHLDQQARFFALPLDEKLKITADDNNRGYTKLFDETLDPQHSKLPDAHEGLYFGRDISPSSEEAKLPLHGPNQWPNESTNPSITGYKATVTEYMDGVTRLGFTLLRIIALSLNLPADFFNDKFMKPMIFLRPLRYTAELSRVEEGKFGAGAHSDYGFLTLLKTDDQPGLQLYHDGQWKDVPPIDGAFIVNLGDMLERWTNGKYKSTLHRVINTTGKIRHSCAFFFEPSIDTVVEALPQCCDDGENNNPRWPPITSGQHLLDRYAQTHAGYKDKMKGVESGDGSKFHL